MSGFGRHCTNLMCFDLDARLRGDGELHLRKTNVTRYQPHMLSHAVLTLGGDREHSTKPRFPQSASVLACQRPTG